MMASGAEEVEVKWKHRNVTLRKSTTDIHVFKQVCVFNQYQIKPGQVENVETVVDLGANIGLSALYFKQKYPNATVIAVEPEKKNYDVMVKNVAGLSNVHCLQNAIWSTNRNLGIHETSYGEYGFVVNDEKDNEIESVKAVTMDDIIANYHLAKIDILKIDIEGSEKELFSGNYTSWLSMVRCIVIELHDWFKPGCASAFFKAISSFEYTMSFKGENVTIIFQNRDKEVKSNNNSDPGNKTVTNVA
jgi:FkbM family methyltransferase